MTAEHPRDRGVDIDLLADYAGGALDGTPERERVRQLVDTDPAWAAALEELRNADALVRADLASLAGSMPAMPDDVAARLDQALRAERERAAPGPAPAPAHTPEVGSQPADVVSLDAKRRRYRRAAVAAVAASVIGIAGVSWYAVANQSGVETGTITDSRGAPAESSEATPGPRPPANQGPTSQPEQPGGGDEAKEPTRYPVPVRVSGKNYTRKYFTTPQRDPKRGGTSLKAPIRAPRGLERLAKPSELRGCLDGIDKTYPGSVEDVDFAHFEDKPALIVEIEQSNDRQRVVVVGPNCNEQDPDITYTVAR